MTIDQAVAKDPDVMSGSLCFRGTRVPVSTLFAHLQAGELNDFYIGFPNVTPEMVEAVLRGSEEMLESRYAKAA